MSSIQGLGAKSKTGALSTLHQTVFSSDQLPISKWETLGLFNIYLNSDNCESSMTTLTTCIFRVTIYAYRTTFYSICSLLFQASLARQHVQSASSDATIS